MRGAWGGTGTRGGYHRRAPVTPPTCPACGGAMVLKHLTEGHFLVPGSLPAWTCPNPHACADCYWCSDAGLCGRLACTPIADARPKCPGFARRQTPADWGRGDLP